jgi:hypothetical protein
MIAASMVAAGVALVAAGCGGGSDAALSTPPSSTPVSSTTAGPAPTIVSSTSTSVPSTTSSSSTTVGPAATAVLGAYRAGWAAFEQASATSNAFDPSLPAAMVDPLLQQVRQNLVSDQAAGIVAKGTFTLHPMIKAQTATSATVVDCAYSTSVLVYAKTGKQVPPVTPPENDGVMSTLVLQGSGWKVSQQTVTDGSCPTGY